MTTPDRVEFGNDLTKRWKRPSKKVVLDAAWLLENTFVITGDWGKNDIVPSELELAMFVRPLSIYADEDAYISLALGVWDKQNRSPEKLTWLTEKQLTKEIRANMRGTCPKYAPDFLPAAVTIALRAQRAAQDMVVEETKAREKKAKENEAKKAAKKNKK